MIRRRREVASVIARMLVVRKARPQARRHIRGLKIARVAAAWRVLGLGIEPLLRQSFDHPQRIARPLVEIHDVVFVVARAMAYWSAVLECRVAWRRRCAAADPSGCGTRRNMPGAPHKGSQHSAGCTLPFYGFPGLGSQCSLQQQQRRDNKSPIQRSMGADAHRCGGKIATSHRSKTRHYLFSAKSRRYGQVLPLVAFQWLRKSDTSREQQPECRLAFA